MAAEDYLDLPERIDLVESLALPESIKAEYDSFEKTLLADLPDGEVIEAINAGVLATKLLQWCNGAIYTSEFKHWSLVHDVKIDALAAIVEDNDEPILVAYTFKSDLERLQKAFPTAVLLDKDPATIDRWNRGEIPMLLAHPQCLHPETEVLTEYKGWVRIIDVSDRDRVFDGVEFVSHKGCVFSGVQPVVETLGLTLTPNHKILINQNWVMAKHVRDCEQTRTTAGYTYKDSDPYLCEMLPLRDYKFCGKTKRNESEQRGAEALPYVYKRTTPQYDEYTNLAHLEGYGRAIQQPFKQRLSSVWGVWSRRVQRVVGIYKLLSGHGYGLFRHIIIGSYQQFTWLQQRKLSLGNSSATTGQQGQQQENNLSGCGNALGRVLPTNRSEQGGNISTLKHRDDRGRGNTRLQCLNIQEKQKISDVYDLVDCGPRNRFLIRNKTGDVFISHNSAGHGLNLQDGGALCVWFGLSWSLEAYLQFNARLHRQGQTRPVRIIHLIAQGCLDERVMSVLQDKDAQQRSLLQALKR
jgi:hypothetical protein